MYKELQKHLGACIEFEDTQDTDMLLEMMEEVTHMVETGTEYKNECLDILSYGVAVLTFMAQYEDTAPSGNLPIELKILENTYKNMLEKIQTTIENKRKENLIITVTYTNSEPVIIEGDSYTYNGTDLVVVTSNGESTHLVGENVSCIETSMPDTADGFVTDCIAASGNSL
jgi:hypothetical protein